MMIPIETDEDPISRVRFYFSHSDSMFTTGVMVIPPGSALPKHNRPLAVENLVQLSGKCLMKLFTQQDVVTEYPIEVGSCLQIPQGQYHIHANPYQEPSLTLFKAEGDITAIMDVIRESFTGIELRKIQG